MPDPVYAHKLQELLGGAFGEMIATIDCPAAGRTCQDGGNGLGALSLYADQVAAFTDLHERVMILLATFAAPALAEAQRAGQLQEALGNRDVIGQAKGILMERHSITADTAFGVLSRVSQAENMKLAEIARHLTETGKLPGVSGPDSLIDRFARRPARECADDHPRLAEGSAWDIGAPLNNRGAGLAHIDPVPGGSMEHRSGSRRGPGRDQ
jgi:ANTAR domain/Manganese containing catalase